MHRSRSRGFDAFIWLAVICGDAMMMLIFTSSAFLAKGRFDADSADLAYVGGAYWLVYVPMAPLWSRLGGRLGLRRVSLLGAGMVLAAAVALTMVSSFVAMVCVVGVLGFGASAMWPNIEAELALGREGPMLRRRLAFFNVMWNSGLILGPLLGMLVYPRLEAVAGADGRALVNVAFYTASGLGVGLVVCLALWRPTVPDADEVREHLEREGGRDPARLHAFWLMAFVANFMAYIVIGVLRHLYEDLASHLWAAEQAATWRHHALLTTMATASVLTYIVLCFAHRWHYRLKRHLAWQILLAGGLLLVALADDVMWAGVGFVVIGAGTAFVYSGSLFYSIEGKDTRTHMAGWHEAVLGLGSLSGLLLAGHVPGLLSRLGVTDGDVLVRSPYVAAVVLFGIGILVQLWIYAHHARRFSSRVATE